MNHVISAAFLDKAEAELKQCILAQLPAGSRLKLFGSRARGSYRWNADFDILIDSPIGTSISAQTIEKIKDVIDESWIPFHVDLITPQHCSGAFGQEVMKDARAWA